MPMRVRRYQSVWLTAGWLALALAVTHTVNRCAARAPEGPVIISLRERVVIGGRVVNVGDVGELRGGKAQVRALVAKLDLADAPTAKEPRTVTRQQILFRVRLANIPESLFRIEGAACVQVFFGRFRVPEAEVIAAACQALFKRLPWSEDEIDIQLLQPIAVPLDVEAAREDITIQAVPHAANTPLGRVQMDLAIYVRGDRRLSFPLYLDVKLCQKVAISTHKIEPGEPLTAANISFDRRPVENLRDYYSSLEMLTNKRARQAILPGSVIVASLLEVDANKPGPILIKQQEAVKMIVRLGPVTVVAAGEALQDGRLGERIRVRNVDSKKPVVGRVVDKSLVEIDP